MTSWKSLLFLSSFKLLTIYSGSCSLLTPVTNSLKEYFAPFIIWHLSPIISSNTRTLPSHGDDIELGSYFGKGRVILLVKKELKVG